ncbi:MAG: hypothetical protein K6T63_02345 [Alicyclobacillus herbarius]|uniref:hypothetical protein n=1 Tax=Alicyclobacillus herbarius TaxID=122960 RepID=UPI00235529BF|nr:hypothetical protein [Alicyclobacillus herbarius]MCL6631448.1 hypothetical protein [Alicyclobacillus herbarius]
MNVAEDIILTFCGLPHGVIQRPIGPVIVPRPLLGSIQRPVPVVRSPRWPR